MTFTTRKRKFESLVNTEGFKTSNPSRNQSHRFESLVNTEGFKTAIQPPQPPVMFESLVNTEGFKTLVVVLVGFFGLRVLLIRKDSKHPCGQR